MPAILAVYVFGSQVDGSATPDSDIDLAFIFDHEEYNRDRFGAHQTAETLGYEIGESVGMPVDVSVLNASSISFAHAVIREGLVLYDREEGERILYEVVLSNKYEDFKPFIEGLRRAKLESISEISSKGH